MVSLAIAVTCLAGGFGRAEARGQAGTRRALAVTIDDGPYIGSGEGVYLARARAVTTRLLATLRRYRVPALLLVNERQLEGADVAETAERTALLSRWLDAGHTLGNHTYSHPDANARSVEAYTEDIAKGDRVTRQLLAARGAAPSQYFRHPFTHTGDTAGKKAAIEAFLTGRGYRVTPHTIENADWQFNIAYGRARGDDQRARVADAYVAFTQRAVAFAEEASVRVFAREIPQVLLLHANELTADMLGRVLEDLARRGYRFVSLEEVMREDAYSTRDTWVGDSGPTWLFRWSRSLGKTVSFADEPEPPAWVVQAAR